MKFLGYAFLVIAAIGLLASVSDALGSAQCLRDIDGLLAMQCASPMTAWLYVVWLAIGTVGTLLVRKRT